MATTVPFPVEPPGRAPLAGREWRLELTVSTINNPTALDFRQLKVLPLLTTPKNCSF